MNQHSRIVHFGSGKSFVAPEPEPLPSKPTRMAQVTSTAAERRLADARHRYELIGIPRPAERVYGRVSLIDRRRDQCAWMDDRDCCGQRTVPNKSWCLEHYRLAHQRNPAPTREAAE